MATLCERAILSVARRKVGLSQVFFQQYTQKASPPGQAATTRVGPPPPAPPPPPVQAPAAEADTDISTYKVPEYYAHNDMSYYSIEEEMEKYRLPQPSKFSPMPPKPKP